MKQVLSVHDLRDARDQVGFFADRLGLDPGRIAGWTFACCIQVALEHRSVGDAEGFGAHLDRAEHLLSQGLV